MGGGDAEILTREGRIFFRVMFCFVLFCSVFSQLGANTWLWLWRTLGWRLGA